MYLNNGLKIEKFHNPYFIAEMNTSHFGKIDVAMEMVERAHLSGANCVKFQSWSAHTLYSDRYYQDNPIAKRFVEKFSLSPEQQKQLAEHCKQVGISFASTPYSQAEVDFLLDHCDVPFIKIASMEITNLPFLDYVARTKSAIILSTGMSSFKEIEQAVETIQRAGSENFAILHCVSVYPAEDNDLNLRNISSLQEMFSSQVIGYSDHSIGSAASCAAVALGASLIEKHFTLDNTVIGMDNQMATLPDDFSDMISKCNQFRVMLGSKERILSADEEKQKISMRRSIIAAKTISAGSVIREADLLCLRPGVGIPPSQLKNVLDKKAIVDIEEGSLISFSDIG